MKLISHRTIKISIILSFLLLSGCSSTTNNLDAFEKNYDFDVYGTLKVAAWFEEEKPLNEVIQSFNERYPHIKIEISYFPSQSYEDYISVITNPNEHFDLLLLSSVYLYNSLATDGKLVNLDTYVENDGINLDVFGTLINDIKIDESTYGLPYRNSVFLLYYNKTLFDEAGVDYPDTNFTWEKFISTARSLTSGSGEDKVWGAFIQNYVQLWTLPAIQDGASFLDDDLSAFEVSIEMMLSLVRNGIAMSPQEIVDKDLVQNGSVKIFSTGNVAMMPMGEWTAYQLLDIDDLDFEWAVMKMPFPQGGRQNVTIGNPSIISILETSSNKGLAFEFIKSLSGPSGASIYAQSKSIPALLTENTRTLYLKGTDPNLELHYFLEAQTEMFSPNNIHSQQISHLFEEVFTDVLNEKISPYEAMDLLYQRRIEIYN